MLVILIHKEYLLTLPYVLAFIFHVISKNMVDMSPGLVFVLGARYLFICISFFVTAYLLWQLIGQIKIV